MNPERIELCVAVACEAHKGQVRRGGAPYITHPMGVAMRFKNDPFLQAVAWLHDVLEDTEETPQTLSRKGVPDDVIRVVEVLTKKGESYEDYLERVRDCESARRVKIQDMLHNLSDQPSGRQIVKYSKGLLFLMGEACVTNKELVA